MAKPASPDETTLPPQAAQGPSGDLQALQGQYAVNTGPTLAYSTEPSVYLGRTSMQGTADHPRPGQERIVPLSQAIGDIYGWDEDRLRDFQYRIIQAGLVQATDISLGARDATTARAWESLVRQSGDAYAAGTKVTPDDLLGELAANPLPSGKQPFVAQVSNPEDINNNLREYLRQKTGSGKVSPDAAGRFQGMEAAAQRQQYDLAQQGSPGGTVVKPPSFDAFAEAEAKRTNPVGFSAHKYLDRFSAIASMLGGQNA